MTATKRRQPFTVRVEQPAELPRTARLYGPAKVLSPALEHARAPHQYDRERRCYLVPRNRLDDVLVAIELAGHLVDIPMAGWS